MFNTNRKAQERSKPNRFQQRPQPKSQSQPSLPTSKLDLFPMAVFIMGIVSCYTTAVGLQPMLDNMVLSYAMAIALSIFMVAIALRIPEAYKRGDQGKMILGYSFVALFSVLLNFNAIYGVFTAEKLLYEELKENKSQLTAIHVKAEKALDDHFGASETERELKEAQALLEEEKTNTMDPGYGKNARRINKESVIPLQAQLSEIRSKYDPTLQQIDSTVQGALAQIDQALASGELPRYRRAVDHSIDAYTYVGETTQNLIGKEGFTFSPLAFEHRDVGNLNHSLWTLGQLGRINARQVSAVWVSLLLAFLIDFIVLFVLVMINKPGQEEAFQEESTPQKPEPRRTAFVVEKRPASPVVEEKIPGIYAHRKSGEEVQASKELTYQPAIIKREEAVPLLPKREKLPQTEIAPIRRPEPVIPPVWELPAQETGETSPSVDPSNEKTKETISTEGPRATRIDSPEDETLPEGEASKRDQEENELEELQAEKDSDKAPVFSTEWPEDPNKQQ